MSNSPTLPTSGAAFAGVPAQCVGDCHFCLFSTDYAYPIYGRVGWNIIGYDIHCGAFDRRVTVVKGCSKYLAVGAIDQPHPLEH